jgi:hypothetical protein
MAGRRGRKSRGRNVPARRRGTSPAYKRLQDQLAKARKSAATARKAVKEQNSAGSVLALSGTAAGGGAAAGALQGALGDLGGWVALGLGIVLVLLGALVIPGWTGGAVASGGAGMLAKSLGDGVESMLGGGDPIEEGE